MSNNTLDFKTYGHVISGKEMIVSQEVANLPLLHPYMKTPFIPFYPWDSLDSLIPKGFRLLERGCRKESKCD
jgi:hypothetical protein